MRKHIRSVVASVGLLACLLMAIPTFGLWGEFPGDQPIEAENWPQSIVKAFNSHRRVYGAGSWEAGYSFYFVGNTEDINQFLAQVSKDKDSILEVLLDPDPGIGTTTRNIDSPPRRISYSWSVYLWPNRQGIGFEVIPGETKEQFQARVEREYAKMPEFRITVTIHCCGSIESDSLKIPLRFTAAIAGHLKQIADYHNDRRRDLKVNGKSLNDEPPTDVAQVIEQTRGSSVFQDDTSNMPKPDTDKP